MEYLNSPCKFYDFISRVGSRSLGLGLPRPAWVRLNRLQTSVGRFRSSIYKWGLAPSCNCKYGAQEQIADHITFVCPTHRAPKGHLGLSILDDETRCRLKKHHCHHLMKQEQPDNPKRRRRVIVKSNDQELG